MTNSNETYSIHVTDVIAFKRCRKQWDYSSRLRRGLEPKRFYSPFFLGRAVHASLEAFYSKNVPLMTTAAEFAALTRAELVRAGSFHKQEEIFEEQRELLIGMMEYYEGWRTSNPEHPYSDANIKFVKLEDEFKIPFLPTLLEFLDDEQLNQYFMSYPWMADIGSQTSFGGRLDGVVKDKEGSYWLWENKTTRSFEDYAAMLDREEQATFYTWAAGKHLNLPLTGILYNAMRKSYPKQPRVLKNGMLSQASSSLDVPAEFYIECIRKHHGSVATNGWIRDNYGETIQKLLDANPVYIQRISMIKTPQEVETFMKDLLHVAAEMLNPNLVPFRSEGHFNCKWCQFQAPCSIGKLGGDEDWMLAQSFQPRTYEVHMLGALEDNEKE